MSSDALGKPSVMLAAMQLCHHMRGHVDRIGNGTWDLGLRLILAWEFFEAGLMKLDGDNWFMAVADKFPWPFDVLPTAFSWHLATWFEILGAVALLAGLATRFFAACLIVLTVVAIKAVHWPHSFDGFRELVMGYAITDDGYGNFKLPVLFLVMFVPLVVRGAGTLSMDHWINKQLLKG